MGRQLHRLLVAVAATVAAAAAASGGPRDSHQAVVEVGTGAGGTALVPAAYEGSEPLGLTLVGHASGTRSLGAPRNRSCTDYGNGTLVCGSEKFEKYEAPEVLNPTAPREHAAPRLATPRHAPSTKIKQARKNTRRRAAEQPSSGSAPCAARSPRGSLRERGWKPWWSAPRSPGPGVPRARC